MEDIFTDTKPCSKCGKPTVIVDIFPKGLCPKCYAEKMDKVPLHEIPKPNFAATVRKRKS
jgi:NMD protein affecting ribosome stability and mRNA decay